MREESGGESARAAQVGPPATGPERGEIAERGFSTRPLPHPATTPGWRLAAEWAASPL